MNMNDLTVFFSFLRFVLEWAPFLFLTYITRNKDTENLLLAYNLLTTELQKVLFLHLFYCQNSQNSATYV
jgi:hypothetical protein